MKTKKTKYVALDIGNVLCHVHTQPFLHLLSETFNITTEESKEFLQKFNYSHDLGLTTLEQELKNNFQVKSHVIIDKIITCWNDSVVPNTFVLDELTALKRKYDLKIALLSNIGIEHGSLMFEKLSHNNFINDAILHFSYFVGARKPTLLYYQSFLLQYPEFAGCVYVDDLKENLTMGSQLGFKSYLFNLHDPDYKHKFEEIKNLIIKSKNPEYCDIIF